MDNERNLVIYAALAVILSYLGFTSPQEYSWIVPVLLMVTAGVLTIAYGAMRYLQRRRMVLDGSIDLDEKHW